MSGRKDRSRSPVNVASVGRRRENNENRDINKNQDLSNVMNLNQMMMANLYQQGNMMMGGMYNMMMPNAMMSGALMTSGGIDSYQALPGPPMEMLPQPQMEITNVAPTQIGGNGGATLDMGVMGGMIVDPSMMGVYSNVGQETVQEKREIVLKSCKLTPPAPGTPSTSRRVRPPGCRTIFIGGLPDMIRESIIRDIFERYGRIQILRLSKKNFCHIRYDREECVDAAMTITGFRIKITCKDKAINDDDDSRVTNGWLHVDYALSRDDQNEYERRQRQQLRMQQQQMQQLNVQQEVIASATSQTAIAQRTPSPTRIQLYSNIAVVQIAERIKNAEHFSSVLPTLIAWLERGDCSKKNSNQFYSMIQTTNSHIRRLYNEKVQAEDELMECKERVKNNIQSIIEQLEQVAKVFVAATHQRVWDHFSKSQRKNIETWQKMTKEFNAMKEEFYEKFFSEDGEFNGASSKSSTAGSVSNEVQELKRENESLRFQLEAYKNEVDVIKSDAQKEMDKFKAQFIARQALQTAFEKNPPLPSPVVKPPPPPPTPPPPPLPDDVEEEVALKEEVDVGCGEAKLIGIMSTFLQVHPHGASLEHVVSYARALCPAATEPAVRRVLSKHDDVFRRTASAGGGGDGGGDDDDDGGRWMFVAFNN